MQKWSVVITYSRETEQYVIKDYKEINMVT